MSINLTPAQIEWLGGIAAERGYASLDEAAQAVIAEAMAGLPNGFEEPQDELVIPLLDEARNHLQNGGDIPLAAFSAAMDQHMAKLKNQ